MICPEYTQIMTSRQSSLLADAGMGDLGEDLGLGSGVVMRGADSKIGPGSWELLPRVCRLLRCFLLFKHSVEIVSDLNGVWMIRAERFFVDSDGATEERFGFAILFLSLQ
jgi:hypothetical protein